MFVLCSKTANSFNFIGDKRRINGVVHGEKIEDWFQSEKIAASP